MLARVETLPLFRATVDVGAFPGTRGVRSPEVGRGSRVAPVSNPRDEARAMLGTVEATERARAVHDEL